MQEQKAAQATPASGAASPAVRDENNDSASPAVQSPANGSQASATPASPGKKDEKPSSTAPYAGKFDPKAIAKRAAAAMDKQKSALGGDVVIPKSAQEVSNSNGAKLADNSKVAPPSSVNGKSRFYSSTSTSAMTSASTFPTSSSIRFGMERISIMACGCGRMCRSWCETSSRRA